MTSTRIPQPCSLYEIRFGESDWRDLEAVVGIVLSVEIREKIQDAVDAYRDRAAVYANSVAPGDIRAPLERIGKAARELSDAFRALGPTSSPASRQLRNTMVMRPPGKAGPPMPDLRAILDYMANLGTAAEEAAAALPRGKKEPKDPNIAGLLILGREALKAARGPGHASAQGKRFFHLLCEKAGANPAPFPEEDWNDPDSAWAGALKRVWGQTQV